MSPISLLELITAVSVFRASAIMMILCCREEFRFIKEPGSEGQGARALLVSSIAAACMVTAKQQAHLVFLDLLLKS